VSDGWRERVSSAWEEGGGSGLCTVSRTILSSSGTGITLIAGEHRSQLCASDARAAALEELQFTIGEGPSVDASRGDHPVETSDLRSAGAQARWPAFCEPALAAGIASVAAFALRIGGARLGVLTVYRERVVSDRSNGEADGIRVAGLLTESILAMQAGAGPDQLGSGLAAAGANRAEVHQASGMIAAQLGVGIAEALVRLRSHAYASGRPIGDVAADVVARRLRLAK
jgi:hypothetical protein